MSSNTGYFILEWLVYILVILLVLECIVSLLNDIIPLKNCEIFSLRWYFWNLPGYLLYGVLVCCSSTTQIRKKGRHCMTWLSRMHVSPAFISCRVVDRLQCTTQTIRHEVVYCQMLITHRLHLIRNKHEVKSRYLLEPFLRISLW